MRRAFLTSFTIFYLLSTISLVGLSFDVKIARANGYIDIRPDGSIYPSTVPISSLDNITYTLTGNITCDYDGIIVFRDNIVIDGKGYTLQGAGNGSGLYLKNISNATIQNMNILGFWEGVCLDSTSDITVLRNSITKNSYYGIYLKHSSNNNINENNITNNPLGVAIGSYSYNNGISKNMIRNKDLLGINNGIFFEENSYNNSVSENDVTNNDIGIHLDHSSNNTIKGNNITKSIRWGLLIYDFDRFNPNGSSNNIIYHNNFINNTVQAYVLRRTDYIWSYRMYGNSWDSGYTFGGNYWNDYGGCDALNGIYQNETGFDWLGDSSYVIDQNNRDRYPLIYPFVKEMEELRISYRSLLLKYTESHSDFETLNSTYHELLNAHEQLVSQFESLTRTVNQMLDNYTSLLASLNNILDRFDLLNSTFTSGQKATLNELGTIRNLMYIFIATTAIFITATLYMAIRKSKKKLPTPPK